MGSQGVRPFWMRFLQLSFFPSFFFSVGFINWNLGFGRLTVETCSWFSPYWLRRELTRWLSKLPPQILNCKALMMTALLISLNLISITLYKEILSKAKLTIDFHCVQPNSSIRLHPSHHGDIFWTLNKRNFLLSTESKSISSSPNGIKMIPDSQKRLWLTFLRGGAVTDIQRLNMQICKCTIYIVFSFRCIHNVQTWSRIDFKFHQTHCSHQVPLTTVTTIQIQHKLYRRGTFQPVENDDALENVHLQKWQFDFWDRHMIEQRKIYWEGSVRLNILFLSWIQKASISWRFEGFVNL